MKLKNKKELIKEFIKKYHIEPNENSLKQYSDYLKNIAYHKVLKKLQEVSLSKNKDIEKIIE